MVALRTKSTKQSKVYALRTKSSKQSKIYDKINKSNLLGGEKNQMANLDLMRRDWDEKYFDAP